MGHRRFRDCYLWGHCHNSYEEIVGNAMVTGEGEMADVWWGACVRGLENSWERRQEIGDSVMASTVSPDTQWSTVNTVRGEGRGKLPSSFSQVLIVRYQRIRNSSTLLVLILQLVITSWQLVVFLMLIFRSRVPLPFPRLPAPASHQSGNIYWWWVISRLRTPVAPCNEHPLECDEALSRHVTIRDNYTASECYTGDTPGLSRSGPTLVNKRQVTPSSYRRTQPSS